MTSNINLLRTFTALFFSGLVILFAILTMPIYQIDPCGIVLPASSMEKNTPRFEKVALFSLQNAPLNFETLGEVSVVYHPPQFNESSAALIQFYAGQLTSMAGGNGLIVKLFGQTIAETPKPLQAQVFRGVIIKK